MTPSVLFSSKRFLYTVTVTKNFPRLKVGSNPKMENLSQKYKIFPGQVAVDLETVHTKAQEQPGHIGQIFLLHF